MKTVNKAYLLGIKGVGMTALACILQDLGWAVSGADTEEVFITDQILSTRKIDLHPLDASIPPDTNLIVYSAAYAPPSSQARTLPLAEAIAEFIRERRVIAVAGVGGKTTTSAMLASLMHSAGRKVGYYLGTSDVIGLPAPGAAGTDPYFVIEADEYAISKADHRPKFALLSPQILITTNILHDHPDIYPSLDDTIHVFTELVRKLPRGSAWICSKTDPLTQQIIKNNQSTIKDIKIIQYSTKHPYYTQLDLQVFGEQNRLDALAAVLAAVEAGLTKVDALKAIKEFRGAKRRSESLGKVNGRLLFDDYGHHPHEIEATLKAFRAEFPNRRLMLIFESHTYSRTQELFSEFAQALTHADEVFVMPIFESAREKGKSHSISHHDLASAVTKLDTLAQAVEWDNAAQVIAKHSQKGDLLLTMGAGFVYKLHDSFKELLSDKIGS